MVDAVLDRRARRHSGIVVGTSVAGERELTARRIGANAIFEIGSITKVFTATLLADLSLEGLVALDDPVQRYLPGGVVLPVRGRPITLADLATHRSGLPRLPKGMLRRALHERKNPYASFGVADLEAAIPRTRPKREPGTKVRYSNYGAGLLGYVLSRAAGKEYAELLEERICRPLGLEDTFAEVPASKLGRFAHGHDRRGRPVPHWDLDALAGAGALRATASDLLTFLELQLSDSDSRIAQAARLTQEPVRLGWWEYELSRGGRVALHHDGGTGGFRSVAGVVPETRTAIAVLTNCTRSVNRIALEVAALTA
jgi:D-alanyl-D-alanine-carboxypeptidase/D-alanyl-D-alanine-endopeptidase